MSEQIILITEDGAVLGGVPCVHCGHTLNAHNGFGCSGGYLRCEECECFGFADKVINDD